RNSANHVRRRGARTAAAHLIAGQAGTLRLFDERQPLARDVAIHGEPEAAVGVVDEHNISRDVLQAQSHRRRLRRSAVAATRRHPREKNPKRLNVPRPERAPPWGAPSQDQPSIPIPAARHLPLRTSLVKAAPPDETVLALGAAPGELRPLWKRERPRRRGACR